MSGAMKKIFSRIYCNNNSWNIKNFSAPSSQSSNPQQNESSRKCRESYSIVPQPMNTASNKEKQRFNSLYQDIVQILTHPYKHIPEVSNHYRHLLDSNVPGHKQVSGLLVVTAFNSFATPDYRTLDNERLAYVLGWCVNLLHSSWLINDDLMDMSETRRGLPCWYKNKNVGLNAVNDAVFIQHSPFVLIDKYIKDDTLSLSVGRLIQDMTLKTTAGQTLDSMSSIGGRPQIQNFSKERYQVLTLHKATYPEFVMPIALAMLVARRNEDRLNKLIHSILRKIGHFYETLNDILDFYGDPLITGKIGTDIRNGKCSWLVVTALEMATESQKAMLYKCYGRRDLESIAKVEQLYEDLQLLKCFLNYQEKSFIDIQDQIYEIAETEIKTFMFKLLCSTYGRH